ncbi:MAG: hypothetical protein ACRC5H_06195 [Treponemataceae bacterium]
MKTYLDTQELDITIQNEKTLGEILHGIEVELEKNDATLIEIKIDNVIVKPDDFEKYFEKDLSLIDTLELISVSSFEITSFIKQVACDYDNLCKKLEAIPVQLQTGQEKAVMQTISELADSLHLFFKALHLSALFPEKFEKIVIEEKSLSEFLNNFSAILKEYLQAFEAKDTVLVGDLSEYEIVPRLQSVMKMVKEL